MDSRFFHQFSDQLLAKLLAMQQQLTFWRSQSAVNADAIERNAHTSTQTATDLLSVLARIDESEKAHQERALQQEILADRKFSLAEAIGREGGSFMKGESAIPRPLRATTQINQFIASHLSESAGALATDALATTLYHWSSNDIRVSRQLDTPLVALAQVIEELLSNSTTFCEFFRQVAIAESQLTGDRPHFQQLGQPPHTDATHTHSNTQQKLEVLLKILQRQILHPPQQHQL